MSPTSLERPQSLFALHLLLDDFVAS